MTTRLLRNFVNGGGVEPPGARTIDVENPSTGEVIARAPLSTAADVAVAVEAAAAAYPAWSRTPAARRVEPLFRLAALLRSHEEPLARQIAEEMGKSLTDAHAEMKRAIENVEVACGMPVLQQGELMVGASFEIDAEVLRLPLGVFAIIAPYNFPAMVPFWFLPTAIATGNTVVLKTSEQVPCTMARVAELCAESGLPAGVLNVVHGDREAAIALASHPKVAGVSFVGSTAVGRQVAELCQRHGKRYQVLGSAKNHLVVMPDANLDDTVRNLVTSCFGCAGQRCMAASAIVPVGEELHRELTRRFVEAAREVPVGNPLDPALAAHPALMGPVISAAARRRIVELCDRALEEGATLALDGRALRPPPGCERGHFLGPTVLTHVRPGSEIHATEVFGPVVVVLRARDFDEALAIVNGHAYGNGASIYTASGHWARRFKLEAEAGMIGVNVGIPAPVAQLPFGGMKASMLSETKAQGTAGIEFFTQRKVVTVRYPAQA